ncbi:MAG: hypothetical protein ACI9RG_001239 [Sulfurimonas sp.]|jgi:hypothetical protein
MTLRKILNKTVLVLTMLSQLGFVSMNAFASEGKSKNRHCI